MIHRPVTSSDSDLAHRGALAEIGRASCFAVPALLAAFASAGCDDCNRSRPYTPFAAESAPSAPEPTTSVATAPPTQVAATTPPPLIDANHFEPPVGRFTLEGRAVELPKRLVAEWSLERDFDHDGKTDSLVWAKPDKVSARTVGTLGELWLFPAGGDARQLYVLPGFVPSGEGCRHDTKLRGIEAEFAWLEVTASCQGSLPQRSPVGVKLLLAPGAAKPVIFGLRVAQTAPGESLAIEPKLVDRDNDGRKDPALEFTLEVTETRDQARLALGWLDRTAGLATDDAYFAASIDTLLKRWEARLAKKGKSPGLERELGAFRRLVGSVCQEAATPRIWDLEGTALRCKLSDATRARVGRIDVDQALATGDVGAALQAYVEAGRWLSLLPAVEREALRKRLDKAFTVVQSSLPVTVTTRPKPRTQAVRYSPLRFDADDSLIVQTASGGLERVKLDGTSETLDLDAASPWPLDVVAPDGSKWTGVVPACDRSELLLSYSATNGSIFLQPTTLLAPRPGVCHSPSRWPAAIAPIAFATERPVAIVGSACISPNGSVACQSPAQLGPVIPGSPRSPDGRRLVFASPLGPVVYGGTKPERWEGAHFDDHPWDCVVANEAKAIACIQSGKLLLVTRATPE